MSVTGSDFPPCVNLASPVITRDDPHRGVVVSASGTAPFQKVLPVRDRPCAVVVILAKFHSPIVPRKELTDGS